MEPRLPYYMVFLLTILGACALPRDGSTSERSGCFTLLTRRFSDRFPLEDFVHSGGTGEYFYWKNSERASDPADFLLIHKFPEAVDRNSRLHFLWEKGALEKLRALLQMNVPILLTNTSVTLRSTGVMPAYVARRTIPLGKEFTRLYPNEFTRSPLLVITPLAEESTIVHETQHIVDENTGILGEIRDGLGEIALGNPISGGEYGFIYWFIVEQRADAAAERGLSFADQSEQYTRRRKSPLLPESILIKAHAKPQLITYAEMKSHQNREIEMHLESYARDVDKILVRLKSEAPAVYRRLLNFLEAYALPGDITSLATLLPLHQKP